MNESQKSSTEVLYRIAINGADQGPYTAEQLHSMVSNSQISPQTPVWTEGMPEWTPYCVLFPAPACPPPVPPEAPAAPAAGQSPNLISDIMNKVKSEGQRLKERCENKAPWMKNMRKVIWGAVGIVALLICCVCIYSWHKGSGADKEFDKGAYYFFSGEEEIAMPYIKSAAEAGNMNAMYLYASTLDDKSEAVEWYEKAARKGQLFAMSELCEAYFHGKGVRADKEKALKLAVKLYKRGWLVEDKDIFGHVVKELDIPTTIVSVLKSGRSIERTDGKTHTKLKNLADKGDGWAQCIYAICLIKKDKDKDIAEEYLLKAASKGMAGAKMMLVELYDDNDRKKEALKLMREMCENGEMNRGMLREYVRAMNKAD